MLSIFLKKILSEIESNHQGKFNADDFKKHIIIILVVEGFDLLLQLYFIINYGYLYRKKLFVQRRRNPLDGSIMDFDPDYDIEQPNYINRYPPEETFHQIDARYYKDQVEIYMSKLNVITLSRQIIL
jgi:hypothetical protein